MPRESDHSGFFTVTAVFRDTPLGGSFWDWGEKRTTKRGKIGYYLKIPPRLLFFSFMRYFCIHVTCQPQRFESSQFLAASRTFMRPYL